MVAKSFQSMKQIGEPYPVGNKMYVKVLNEKTGTERQVRWYTDAEYAKMYPEETKTVAKKYGSLKEALGFTNGYITIFKGDTYSQLDWFRLSNARYHRRWGWYVVSTEEVPEDLPEGITPVKLIWESISINNESLKPEDAVKGVIDSLLYEESSSEYVGTIGERLTLTATVVAARPMTGYYGPSTMHTLEDAAGNRYIWTTSAKTWTEGSQKTFKGSVREHKMIKNVKCTILTRCSEI